MLQNNMKWLKTIWFEIIWNNRKWYDIKWDDIKGNDMIFIYVCNVYNYAVLLQVSTTNLV